MVVQIGRRRCSISTPFSLSNVSTLSKYIDLNQNTCADNDAKPSKNINDYFTEFDKTVSFIYEDAEIKVTSDGKTVGIALHNIETKIPIMNLVFPQNCCKIIV